LTVAEEVTLKIKAYRHTFEVATTLGGSSDLYSECAIWS
jgi:hypothetical protein